MILNIHNRNKPVKDTIFLPGDKSIAQRAIILASIAEGKSILRNVPLSDDCLAVIRCIRQLGVEVREIATWRQGATRNDKRTNGTVVVTIKGRGLYGLRKPSKPLNVGESGTAARLMTGLLAGQVFPSVITGKKTVLNRPMKRVIEPLTKMGAKIESKDGRLPLRIYPSGFALGTSPARLKGIKYTMPVASAQVKSAILLAGLYAEGETIIREKIPTRDHTERLMNLMGVPIKHSAKGIELRIRSTLGVYPASSGTLRSIYVVIPGDFSSAAYFIAAGLLIPGSEITIKNVGLNPFRTGLLTVLKMMNAKVSCLPVRQAGILYPASCIHGNEPIGDIRVKSSSLNGVTVPGKMIPSIIDEIPILALIATQAKGTTVIKGASELRVKESDRIKAIVTELAKLGADISETPDGMIIKGPTKLHGAICQSHNDHRMAMTLSIAGLVADGRTQIKDAEVINKSFPSFVNYNIFRYKKV